MKYGKFHPESRNQNIYRYKCVCLYVERERSDKKGNMRIREHKGAIFCMAEALRIKSR